MSKLRVTLYGGVNEIGGNKFLVEEGDHRLFLDFGTSIGARNSYYEGFLPPRGNSILRDLFRLNLLPDVDGVYRDDFLEVAKSATDKDLPESAAAWRARHGGRAGVDAVLLTHAHVDHFQDLSFLDAKIPVYCTATTKRMLQAIDEVGTAKVESEILEIRQRSVIRQGPKAKHPGREKVETSHRQPRDIRIIHEMEPKDIAGFRVTAVPVDHSVPGACAFFIETPRGKRIFYTGDVRFHGRLMDRTSKLLKFVDGLAPDIMLCEGTRINKESKDNEADVERGINNLVAETPGLAIAEFSWKDTTRFDTLQRVAEAQGRTLLVDPRLAHLLHRLDTRADVPSRRVEAYDNVGVYLRREKSMLYSEPDYDDMTLGYLPPTDDEPPVPSAPWLADPHWLFHHNKRATDIRENPDKYILHLTYYRSSELFDLDPAPGSRWIRCATEPYSPEMAIDLGRQKNWLDTFGLAHNVDPAHTDDASLLSQTTHVSGHGGGPDLIRLMKLAAPTTLVPVHVDEKNLDHYDGLAADVRTFKGVGFRDAGRGRCVVEL